MYSPSPSDLPFFCLLHLLPILFEKLLEPLVGVKTISILGGILNRKYDVGEIGSWQTFNRLLLACVCLDIAQNLPDSPGYLCLWPFNNELSEDSSSFESAAMSPCPFNKGFVGWSQDVFQQPSCICNFQLNMLIRSVIGASTSTLILNNNGCGNIGSSYTSQNTNQELS